MISVVFQIDDNFIIWWASSMNFEFWQWAHDLSVRYEFCFSSCFDSILNNLFWCNSSNLNNEKLIIRSDKFQQHIILKWYIFVALASKLLPYTSHRCMSEMGDQRNHLLGPQCPCKVWLERYKVHNLQEMMFLVEIFLIVNRQFQVLFQQNSHYRKILPRKYNFLELDREINISWWN